MAITLEQLCECMPTLPQARAQSYLPALQAAMSEFQISHSNARAAAFLAQIGHETNDLKWWSEIWGPTSAQRGYEGRKDLGNTEQGDGYKYRGRGPIQLTGRANYRRYGAALNVNLEQRPELAATPTVGFRIAGQFWADHGLNRLADEGKFEQITRRINGGNNGAAERLERYRRCLKVLG